jgi:mono/diheme cytochrome c family protein
MSADPKKNNPRIEQAGASDESIQRVHSVLLREKAEPAEGFAPMPLFLLGFISTMIFLVSIYMVHYRGGFDSMVYDERFDPATMGKGAEKVAVDPFVAGKRHYTAACLACHQANGLGLPPAFPPLVGSDWVVGSEERLIRILLHGLEGPIEVNGVTYNGIMPAFGAGSAFNWNDQRISEVLTFIRAEWGNTASPITAEQVTAIRTGAAAGRSNAWTAPELLALP